MTFGVHCSWNSPNLSAKLTGRYVMGAPLSIVEPHEARGRRSPHRHHPAVAVVALAVLDGLDRVVEALQRLAGLVLAAKPQRLLAARDRGDRRDHRGGVPRADLDEILALLPAQRPGRDAQPPLLRDGGQGVLGHALAHR